MKKLVIGLMAVALLAFSIQTIRHHASSQTTIGIGVAAYQNDIASEPAGLSYIYKYIIPARIDKYTGPSIIPGIIQTAYAYGLKPIIVVFTNYGSTSPDWPTWDASMDAIRQDGRVVDVIVEPDLFGYVRNNNTCGTVGKQLVDRFLSTAPANARLGFMMSPWLLPYNTPAGDAAGWNLCWLQAAGDRMPNIYVDVTDRDQEYKGTYPWSATKILMFENWFKELSKATGRKIGVWQIPLGNSLCLNGRRSNFVENWLVQSKLDELSPYVDKLLFGSADDQTLNLPRSAYYDCGMFNSRVMTLAQIATRTPTMTVRAPTATGTVFPTTIPTNTPLAPSQTPTATPTLVFTYTPTPVAPPTPRITFTPTTSPARRHTPKPKHH